MANFINYSESFSFDDLLLIPKYSEVMSRADVDLTIDLGKGFKLAHPVVPSNMKTITELAMARFMYKSKGMAIFHRFEEFEKQLGWLEEIKKWGDDATQYIGFSVGVKPECYKQADILVENGCKIICIDVAHGDHKNCVDMTTYVAKQYPQILLISGNVATGRGARRLWEAGADIVKVGIGQGSTCLTRVNTGAGVSSMTSLAECHDMRKIMERHLNRKLFIIQDGGVRNAGDISKSLCFANLIMGGNIFAGTDEAAPDIVEINGIKYKPYVGSSTYRGVHREGVEGYKKYKGPASKVLEEITDGVRSCCSYQGVYNLEDLKKDPKFTKITTAGLKESNAHDLDLIKK